MATVNNYRLWYYTASHDQMLIRRRDMSNGKNFDVVFDGVSYVELPTFFDNAEFVDPNSDDIDYLQTRVAMDKGIVTVLKISGKKYYIVSAHVNTVENNLSYDELPFYSGLRFKDIRD